MEILNVIFVDAIWVLVQVRFFSGSDQEFLSRSLQESSLLVPKSKTVVFDLES